MPKSLWARHACGCNPQDDDVLKISANASDLKFTSYKYSSIYEASRDYSYQSSYNSSRFNCYGSYYETSWDYSRESNYSDTRFWEKESRRTLDGNTVEATGLDRSVVRACLGDDAISIDAIAERTASSAYRNPQATATGIKNSLIDAGAGNDSLSINAEASAEYESNDKYSYNRDYSRSYSYSIEYERAYESVDGSRSSGYLYSYDYSRDYSRAIAANTVTATKISSLVMLALLIAPPSRWIGQ